MQRGELEREESINQSKGSNSSDWRLLFALMITSSSTVQRAGGREKVWHTNMLHMHEYRDSYQYIKRSMHKTFSFLFFRRSSQKNEKTSFIFFPIQFTLSFVADAINRFCGLPKTFLSRFVLSLSGKTANTVYSELSHMLLSTHTLQRHASFRNYAYLGME